MYKSPIFIGIFLINLVVNAQVLTPKWYEDKYKSEGAWSCNQNGIIPVSINNGIVYFFNSGNGHSQIMKFNLSLNSFEEISFNLNKKFPITYKRRIIDTNNGPFVFFEYVSKNNYIIAKSDLVNSPYDIKIIYEEKIANNNINVLTKDDNGDMNIPLNVDNDLNYLYRRHDSTGFIYLYGQGALDDKESPNITNIVYLDENLDFQKKIQYTSKKYTDIEMKLKNFVYLNNGDVYLQFHINNSFKYDSQSKSFVFNISEGIKKAPINSDEIYQIVYLKNDGTIKEVDFFKNKYSLNMQLLYSDNMDDFSILNTYINSIGGKLSIYDTIIRNELVTIQNGDIFKSYDMNISLPKDYKLELYFPNKEENNFSLFFENNSCSNYLFRTDCNEEVNCSSSSISLVNFSENGVHNFTTNIDKEYKDMSSDIFIGSYIFLYNDFYYVLYNDQKHEKEIEKLGVLGDVKTCLSKIDKSGKLISTYYIDNTIEGYSIEVKSSVFFEEGKILLLGRGKKYFKIGILDIP
jgi:hypothetical protein